MVTIVSLSHRHYEPVLKMIGRSGKSYPFRWDSKVGYYTYETESQEVVSDLFEGSMHWQHGYLSIILPPAPAKAAPAPEPPAPPRARKRARKQTVVAEKQ